MEAFFISAPKKNGPRWYRVGDYEAVLHCLHQEAAFGGHLVFIAIYYSWSRSSRNSSVAHGCGIHLTIFYFRHRLYQRELITCWILTPGGLVELVSKRHRFSFNQVCCRTPWTDMDVNLSIFISIIYPILSQRSLGIEIQSTKGPLGGSNSKGLISWRCDGNLISIPSISLHSWNTNLILFCLSRVGTCLLKL